MTRFLRLIADDLTGALDSAAQFSAGDGAIPVYWRSVDIQAEAGPAAFVSPTRERSEAEAAVAAVQASVFLHGADPAFKKIDSLLRGPWAAEAAAMMKAGAFRTCILAPAFPAQGRITRDGRQALRQPDGRFENLSVDPAGALAARDAHVRRVGRRDRLDDAPGVILCDAETNEDLDEIVAMGRGFARAPLWCGSAGLARALAGEAPARAFAVTTPFLAIVGSHHPVSRAQIATARIRHPDAWTPIDAGGADAAARIAATLARCGRCLTVVTIEEGASAAEAAAAIDRALRTTAPLIPRPSTLFAAGGETLLTICEALGADRLDVEGERSPGVPVSRMRGGVWDGVTLVSKSGAFGDAGLLADMLAVGL